MMLDIIVTLENGEKHTGQLSCRDGTSDDSIIEKIQRETISWVKSPVVHIQVKRRSVN